VVHGDDPAGQEPAKLSSAWPMLQEDDRNDRPGDIGQSNDVRSQPNDYGGFVVEEWLDCWRTTLRRTFSQVNGDLSGCPGAPCKTVGLAYDGSNPSPTTTSENGPRPGVSPASQTVVRCVILCHGRSGDVAAPRWLRTYSGRIRGWRSGSPNRLLRTLPGV